MTFRNPKSSMKWWCRWRYLTRNFRIRFGAFWDYQHCAVLRQSLNSKEADDFFSTNSNSMKMMMIAQPTIQARRTKWWRGGLWTVVLTNKREKEVRIIRKIIISFIFTTNNEFSHLKCISFLVWKYFGYFWCDRDDSCEWNEVTRGPVRCWRRTDDINWWFEFRTASRVNKINYKFLIITFRKVKN